jgi:hypothetical protein
MLKPPGTFVVDWRCMSWEAWKRRARQLSAQTYALYLAYRHPRTPWYAKVFAALVVGYVFSPIDPIPDFIPGVGLGSVQPTLYPPLAEVVVDGLPAVGYSRGSIRHEHPLLSR